MDTTLQDPLVGRELDGRYLVRSRIARGGMATVYLALDSRLDREVAIKVMHAHLADDEQFTARFLREARSTARLSHPNVVQVYDQGEDGELLFLIMEYLRGRTLREVLAERRVLTPREALTVVEPVLDALAAAHRIGIVHRDIKPENVILTDDGRVKVADFGLARAATANTSTVGVLMGTVAYLAPEMVVQGLADTRSDVYAAGIMLFEMLTGRQPFDGEVPIQVAYRHVNEQVPVPSRYAPGLPQALDAVVAAATAREPDDRPRDAEDLLGAVRAAHAALSADQLDARPAGPNGSAGPAPSPYPSRATEVFSPDAGPASAAPNPTRALPELAAGMPPAPSHAPGSAPGHAPTRQDGARNRRPWTRLSAPPIDGPGRGREAVVPHTPAEDAALAALLRRRRRIGQTALLGVLGLALALAVTAWYFAAGPGAYLATPRVAGLSLEQARTELTADGLRSRQQDVFDDRAPAGVVVGTVPAEGEDVRKDGTVVLKVSRGPEQVEVPKVVGLQDAAARTALTDGHLTVGQVTQVYDDAPRGEVLSSKPELGTEVRNGTTVELTESKGPQPVDLPDLVGMSRREAEHTLRDLGLDVHYGDPQTSQDVEKDHVLSQSPGPDDGEGTIAPGQAVTLVLSKGPEQVEVPPVTGKSFEEASRILTDAGFDVRRAFFSSPFGTVRSQDPKPGRTAPKGSTVTLHTR